MMRSRFTKDEVLFDVPGFYTIFMVIGDGWYVFNKLKRTLKRFSFKTCTYVDVINYTDSIGQ